MYFCYFLKCHTFWPASHAEKKCQHPHDIKLFHGEVATEKKRNYEGVATIPDHMVGVQITESDEG